MNLWSQLPVEWQLALKDMETSIEKISDYLDSEIEINPEPKNIFKALGQSPDQFRVIIVGQDPYPNKKHAMGIAFSVPSGEKIPPSLHNITKELHDDLGIVKTTDLTSWSENGVLLLNRILTCRTGESLSHSQIGWQKVTESIIKAIITVNPNAVGILWGKNAQEVSALFNPKLIITSPHPSGLSAHRGFFGTKPFSSTNRLLMETGQPPINWA